MNKAKYIGKTYGTRCDRDSVYLEYEYKGRTYTVHVNNSKGNEPLSWQHKSNQSFIDRMLKIESKSKSNSSESYEKGIELFYQIYN